MMTNLGSSEEQKSGKKIFSPILVCYSYPLFLTSDLHGFEAQTVKCRVETVTLPPGSSALLTENPHDVIVKHKDHEHGEDEETRLLGPLPPLDVDFLARDELDQKEQQVSAVQHWDGE